MTDWFVEFDQHMWDRRFHQRRVLQRQRWLDDIQLTRDMFKRRMVTTKQELQLMLAEEGILFTKAMLEVTAIDTIRRLLNYGISTIDVPRTDEAEGAIRAYAPQPARDYGLFNQPLRER